MKARAVVLGLLAPLAFASPAPAVTLIAPQGQPIGGQWQQWVDEAQMPTLSGTLLVDNDPAPCMGGAACSSSPNMALQQPDGSLIYADGPAETWAAPNVAEWSFDFELGHQFDWAYLTDADRAEFAQLWGSTLHWWDTLAGTQQSMEDGLEAEYADIYATCAVGDPTPAILTAWLPGVVVTDPEPSCQLIDEIGAEVGADPPAPPPPVTAGAQTAPSGTVGVQTEPSGTVLHPPTKTSRKLHHKRHGSALWQIGEAITSLRR
jgi:hypothetical protein